MELILGISQSIRHLLQQEDELEAIQTELESFKNAFKISVYLIAKVLFDGEKLFGENTKKKSKKPNKVDSEWSKYRESLLLNLQKSLFDNDWIDLGRLWNCGLPELEFLNLYWQLAEMYMLERNELLSSDQMLNDIISSLVELVSHCFHTTLSHVIVSSFAHSLTKHEHFCQILANILRTSRNLVEKYEDTRLCRAVILEIGRLEFEQTTKDLNGVKRVGFFIEQLSMKIPVLVRSNLSVLLPHFNDEAYPIRCSLVRAIAHLVEHLKGEKELKEAAQEKERTEGDDEEENTSVGNTRDKLIDILVERAHDVTSYVRAEAIRSLATLSAHQAIPISYFLIAADICTERIHDKSSIVRKQAMASLSQLVLSNPYNSSLKPSSFANKIDEVDTWLKENENSQDDAERKKKLDFLKYCKDSLLFITKIERACEQVKRLQCSKSMSDVLESMRLLSVAHKFKVPAAKESIKNLFVLIWDTRESGRIRKELLQTFEETYISRATEDGKRAPYEPPIIASNLVALASSSSLAEFTSLEKILAESVKKDGILGRRILPYAAIDELWELAALNHDEGDGENNMRIEEIDQSCRAALCVLSALCCSKACPLNNSTTFETMTSISFGPSAKRRCDYGLARYAFVAMLRWIQYNNSVGAFTEPQLERILSCINCILCWEWEKTDVEIEPSCLYMVNCQWFPAAEQAIRLLFQIEPNAEDVCTQVLRIEHNKVFEGNPRRISHLSRLAFVIGHVAVKLSILSEKIASDMKKARAVAEENRENCDEEESGLMEVNGSAGGDEFEDGIVRRLLEMADPCILTSYIPCFLIILNGKYPVGKELRTCSVSALCKLMSVSEALCEQHLPFVLTVLRDAAEFEVRANVIISLGDLASRFPNVVEPFTRHIYKSLRDVDARVRKNTLMVLTHLILNDMVKVRGEVSELALCLEDEDERIQDLAGLFFTELSKRGSNPVYNLLPDTLASVSRQVDSVKFERIAKFLLSFVSGDKKAISTAEKLCSRIYSASGVTYEESIVIEDTEQIKLIRDLSFGLTKEGNRSSI